MVPAIAVGLTVITFVAVPVSPQALVMEYIIESVPAETPVAIPVVEIVATELLVLLHAPPVVASVNVIDAPWQTADAPPIAAGIVGLELVMVTLSRAVAVPQVLVTMYLTVSAPAEMPVAIPVLVMVAKEVLLILQVPPVAPEAL
jgi:hypothetical protein